MPNPFRSRRELWDAVVTHLEKLREARGYTAKELAHHAGISYDTYKTIVYRKLAFSEETARRLVEVLMGGTFEGRPKMRHFFKIKPEDRKTVRVWWHKKKYREIEKAAESMGIGVRSLILIAVQRFLDDNPPMTSIRRVKDQILLALVKDDLETTPSLRTLLEMDEELVRNEAMRKPVPVKADHERATDPSSTILRTTHRFYDGATEHVWYEREEAEDDTYDLDLDA